MIFFSISWTQYNTDEYRFRSVIKIFQRIYLELSAVYSSSPKSVCFNSPAFDFRPQFPYSHSDGETHGKDLHVNG